MSFVGVHRHRLIIIVLRRTGPPHTGTPAITTTHAHMYISGVPPRHVALGHLRKRVQALWSQGWHYGCEAGTCVDCVQALWIMGRHVRCGPATGTFVNKVYIQGVHKKSGQFTAIAFL